MAADKMHYASKVRGIFIFKYLNDGELADLLAISEIVACENECTILSEGELSPYFFAIVEGTVNVSVKTPDGTDAFVCAIGYGEIFGEAGIFLKVRRTASVIAAGQATVLRISRENLFTFVKSHPDAGVKILMLIIYSMLKRLRSANQELAFERSSDLDQNDIDSLIQEYTDSE